MSQTFIEYMPCTEHVKKTKKRGAEKDLVSDVQKLKIQYMTPDYITDLKQFTVPNRVIRNEINILFSQPSVSCYLFWLTAMPEDTLLY